MEESKKRNMTFREFTPEGGETIQHVQARVESFFKVNNFTVLTVWQFWQLQQFLNFNSFDSYKNNFLFIDSIISLIFRLDNQLDLSFSFLNGGIDLEL